MADKEKHQIDLDAFFKDAAKPAPELSNALMANILADAGEVAAARQVLPEREFVKRRGWLARVMEPMGGIQGLAAIGVCTALGITIGYAGTDTLQSIPGVGDIVASISGDPLDDFSYGDIAGFSDFLAEG
ncbi:MAG: hypothetical protein JKY41_07390 [Rhodobacteraceae bacterium]|nr:hypothetical protein [Paracoccaceae bacterium]